MGNGPQSPGNHYILGSVDLREHPLRAMLILAWHTERRIGAICHLKASDVLSGHERVSAALAAAGENEVKANEWPHCLRWRAEYDKAGYETITPVNPAVVGELGMYLRDNPRVGDTWLFPMARDVSRPADRRTVMRYLLRGENLAELPKLERGGGMPSDGLGQQQGSRYPFRT